MFFPEPVMRALITGSGKNIGRAIALRLAKDGMNLVIHGGSDLDACEQTAREAESLGAQTHVTVGDVSNRSEVKRISEEALQTFGRVDVLIHNAATRPHQNLFEISDEEWDRVLEVNLGAAFQFCRLLIPGMLEQQWGKDPHLCRSQCNPRLSQQPPCFGFETRCLGTGQSPFTGFCRSGHHRQHDFSRSHSHQTHQRQGGGIHQPSGFGSSCKTSWHPGGNCLHGRTSGLRRRCLRYRAVDPDQRWWSHVRIVNNFKKT